MVKLAQDDVDVFFNIMNDEENKDLFLICDDGVVKAHRMILAGCSSLLKGIFESIVPDSNQKILLPGFSLHSVNTWIQLMYTGICIIEKGEDFSDFTYSLDFNLPVSINRVIHDETDSDIAESSVSDDSQLHTYNLQPQVQLERLGSVLTATSSTMEEGDSTQMLEKEFDSSLSVNDSRYTHDSEIENGGTKPRRKAFLNCLWKKSARSTIQCSRRDKCWICLQDVCNHQESLAHKTQHDTESSFPCQICCKVFQTQQSVRDHHRSHYKQHECPHCHKKAIRPCELKSHKCPNKPSTSTKGRRTIFKSRKSSVSNQKSLQKVIKNDISYINVKLGNSKDNVHLPVPEEYTIQGSGNGSNFQEQVTITQELFSTDGKDDVECTVCDMRFLNTSILKRHYNQIHSNCSNTPTNGSTFFSCVICDEKFECDDEWQLHRVTHTTFRCCECTLSYRSEVHLHKHRIMSHMEYPLHCLVCDIPCCHRGEVQQHILTSHYAKQ